MSYFASFADCGDKKCNNGGTLNAETCECECKKIYTGPTCDECKIFYIVKLVNLSFLRKKKNDGKNLKVQVISKSTSYLYM